MLKARSESEILAEKVRYALDKLGFADTYVAAQCGVTKQAVNGWRKTGRMRKGQLPMLAALTGLPLEWWTDPNAPVEGQEPHTSPDQARKGVSDLRHGFSWPFTTGLYQRFQRLTQEQKRDVEEALGDHVSRLERRGRPPRKRAAG